jgi:prevent-host-death family protein
MRKVGLKILKNKLSEYVRRAAGGETIQVTDRNRVVAKLVPPEQAQEPLTPEEKWAEMIRQGIVTPARRPFRPLPPRKPIMPFKQLMKELDEDREDQWDRKDR